jgi:hypothetical protein
MNKEFKVTLRHNQYGAYTVTQIVGPAPTITIEAQVIKRCEKVSGMTILDRPQKDKIVHAGDIMSTGMATALGHYAVLTTKA